MMTKTLKEKLNEEEVYELIRGQQPRASYLGENREYLVHLDQLYVKSKDGKHYELIYGGRRK